LPSIYKSDTLGATPTVQAPNVAGQQLVSHTAGRTVAVDGGHPQVGRAAVKDDLEGLRWSSDGDESVVRQLETEEEVPMCTHGPT